MYFIFILNCGNDVRQRTNLSNFLIQVQTSHKAVETTYISNAFGPETAAELTVQWSSGRFAKETRDLRMKNIVAGHQKLTMTN